MNNFIITCSSGRAGTKFLTKQMNRSKKWTVIHDKNIPMFYPPYSEESIKNIDLINKRLNQNNYGEICGVFYFNLSKFKVAKKGYIIRNPIKEFISTVNFNPGKNIDYFLSCVNNWKSELEDIERRIIDSDVDYFHSMLEQFGIDDVTVTEADLNAKVNSSGKKRINTIEDLSTDVREKLEESYNWYIEKYNLRK